MKMIVRTLRTCCFLIALSVVFMQASTQCYGFEITIDVAPAVLNLQNNAKVVTVHTDIAFGDVDVSAVYLNGVLIDSWKADNRGNFVAKFIIDAIKTLDGLIIDEYNTLQLVGATTDGESFAGADDILVVNNVPSGK